ncbi:MAG: heavy metal-associated domain-containing protein [Bacteroidota bacterium]
MKTFKVFSFLPLLMAFAVVSFAQKTKTETIPVSGNCGMCEAKIEKAAKEAGASNAEWSRDTKMLTVKYNSSSTNAAKIQQAIANAGYDTRDFKTTDAAYNKLHACCQYDRTESAKEDCCKDGKCSKPGHNGKDCCQSADQKMDCCKDGKCSKPGHDGKDCCKKS